MVLAAGGSGREPAAGPARRDEWYLGGDGGWMHWSIPTDVLRAGDFVRAIPTPDIW